MNAPDDVTVDSLFASPPRLGWTYRTPPSPRQLPPPPHDLRAARRMYYTGLALAAGLVLAIPLAVFNAAGIVAWPDICGLFVAGYFLITSLDQRYRRPTGFGLGALVILSGIIYNLGLPLLSGVIGLSALGGVVIGLPAVSILRGKHLLSRAKMMDEQMKEEEAAEQRRWRTEPLWRQVPLTPTAKVLTVVGGSAYGWEALVTTLGTSLLADTCAITLLNFSERSFAAELCTMAAYRGFTVDVVHVPDDLDGVALLSGFTPDELAGLLADAVHAGEEKADRKMAISDRDILAKVCEKLDRRPLSIERVRAGLRVILRSESWSEASSLDESEHEALQEVFSDDLRQRTNLLQSAWDIERQLGALAGLASRLGTTTATAVAATHDLTVFELGRDNEALDNEYVVDLLFQLLLRSFRRGDPMARPEHTIIVAGADRLRSRHLQDLAKFTERTSARLVYLFEHYGPDARQMVGRGGGCAAFMALGNDEDAKGVAEFIGHEHKFLDTGMTKGTSHGVTHSNSTTDTRGQSKNYQPSFFVFLDRYVGRSVSRSWGVTRSISESTTESSSINEQRVYELTVEPYEIQQLPATAFFYVGVALGVRETVVADCNPDIAGLPRVERGSRRDTLESAS